MGGVALGLAMSILLALLIYGVFNVLDDTVIIVYDLYGITCLCSYRPNGLLDE